MTGFVSRRSEFPFHWTIDCLILHMFARLWCSMQHMHGYGWTNDTMIWGTILTCNPLSHLNILVTHTANKTQKKRANASPKNLERNKKTKIRLKRVGSIHKCQTLASSYPYKCFFQWRHIPPHLKVCFPWANDPICQILMVILKSREIWWSEIGLGKPE